MKVINNTKTKILSRPDRSESRIIDITQDDKGNKTYSYEFFFNADIREAINLNSFNVRLCVRTKNKESKVQMFGDLSDKSAKSVIASLYGKSKDNKDKLTTSNRDTLITSVMIDLSKYVNNKKLKNAKKLSDRQLFGTVTKTKLSKLQNFTGKDSSITVLQKNIPNDDIEFSNGGSFKTNYLGSITSAIDPSEMTMPIVNETSGDSRKNQLFSGNEQNTSGPRLRGIQSGMRSKLESPGNFSFSNQSTTAKMRSNDTIAIPVSTADRIKLISTKINLLDSQTKSRDIFNVTVELTGKNNIVIQKLVFSIKHKQNIDNFYIPTSIPTIAVSKSSNVQNNDVKISINNTDKCIKSVEVFKRDVSETQDLLSTSFKKLNSYSFKNTNEIDSFSIRSAQGGKKTSIVRAVPVSQTNEVFGNFSSSILSRSTIQQNYASIISKSVSGGVKVKIINYPQSAIGVLVVRRNLTKREKTFVELRYLDGKKVDTNEIVLNQQSQSSKVVIVPKNKTSEIVITDTNVKADSIYEYKARLNFKNGTSRLSRSSSVIKFVEPLEMVSVDLTNITIDKSTNNVSFNVGYTIAETDADILLNSLNSLGLADLYSDDIQEIKGKLQNLVIFDIDRFDKITGETVNIGLFSNGEVIDSSTATNAESSQLYTYTINPYIMSPDDVLSDLIDIENNTELVSNTKDLRNPSTFSSLRKKVSETSKKSTESAGTKIERFSKDKSTKNLSRSSLSRGTLQSVDVKSNKTLSSTLKNSPTGDSISVDVDTGFKSFTLSSGNISEGGHGGAVIRWSVSEGRTGSSKIDYFVVMAKKQGRNVIAGNCHYVSSLRSAFIDYSSKEFVGTIEYSVVPVFLDGSLGSAVSVGKITQSDKNTTFKRGN